MIEHVLDGAEYADVQRQIRDTTRDHGLYDRELETIPLRMQSLDEWLDRESPRLIEQLRHEEGNLLPNDDMRGYLCFKGYMPRLLYTVYAYRYLELN